MWPREVYTRGFERYALSLLQSMTIRDVARHLGVSWDVIKDLQKRHLKRRYGKPKLRNLKQIAIDEISIGKGHQYLVVPEKMISLIDAGVVLFIHVIRIARKRILTDRNLAI